MPSTSGQVALAQDQQETLAIEESVHASAFKQMKDRYEILVAHNEDLNRILASTRVGLDRMTRARDQQVREKLHLASQVDRINRELSQVRTRLYESNRKRLDEEERLKRRIEELEEELADERDRVRAGNKRAKFIGEKLDKAFEEIKGLIPDSRFD